MFLLSCHGNKIKSTLPSPHSAHKRNGPPSAPPWGVSVWCNTGFCSAGCCSVFQGRFGPLPIKRVTRVGPREVHEKTHNYRATRSKRQTLGNMDSSSKIEKTPMGLSIMSIHACKSIPKSSKIQSRPSLLYSSCSNLHFHGYYFHGDFKKTL